MQITSFITLLFISYSVAQLDNTLVVTPLGPLRGKRYEFKSKFNQRPINAFIGVPYAKPPIGDNRFKLPQQMDSWKTEKDVTNNVIMCPQVSQRFRFQLSQPIREDEDCLYLNIFIPLSSRPTNGFPVMVYLHPGSFQYSGKDFYPPEYLLDNDIILVTLNYRLGVLGFLSTGDDSSPGNFGIHDQIAALKWISANIALFGGHSQNITVFGHDAGAISASILLISSQSWGLFHNVMVLSGSAFTPNALKMPDFKNTIDFGRVLNCQIENTLEQNQNNFSFKLVECLRKLSVQELMRASRLPGLNPNTFQFTFGPVIDNNVSFPLIIDWPQRLYQLGNYWKIPLVAGINLNEGSLEYFLHYDKIRYWTLTEKLQYLFNQFQYNEFYSKLLYKSVEWFYFKRWNETQNNYLNNNNRVTFPYNQNIYPQNQNKDWINQLREELSLIDSIGDFLYGSADSLLLDLHSQNSKYTYMYTLEHKGLKSFGPLQLNGSQSIHRDQYGVTHMDDIFYLFPTLYNNNITSTYDEPVIKTICQHFTHFAKYGKFAELQPISAYQSIGYNWIPYTRDRPYYLKFISQATLASQGFRSEFYSFWNYFVREIFLETYNGNHSSSQISASFVGTVQLRGLIKFGNNNFVIS